MWVANIFLGDIGGLLQDFREADPEGLLDGRLYVPACLLWLGKAGVARSQGGANW